MKKNQIVIVRNNNVVENMVSKISNAKDLRARIAKHFPGKRAVYFKVNKDDPNRGCFFHNKQKYDWFIQSTERKNARSMLTGRKLKPVIVL